MDSEETKQPLPRVDRILVVLAIALLLFFFAFYLNDDLFKFLFRIGKSHSAKPVIGEITLMKNDTRHRDSDELTWDSAYGHQEIRADDSVFTGAGSSANVKLKHGSVLEMGENTLIVFSQLNGQELPQLARGTLEVTVKGGLKMNIGGETTEFDGENAHVQIFVGKENKTQFKLISGAAKVKSKVATYQMKPNVVASVAKPDVLVKPAPRPLAKLFAQQLKANYDYFNKVYDIYEHRENEDWSERQTRENFVRLPVLLTWKSDGEIKKVYGQHATTNRYDKPFLFEFIGTAFATHEVFLGDNFWRVSPDRMTWSEAHFNVTPQFLPDEPPKLKITRDYLLMFSDSLYTSFPIESAVPYVAFIAETSTSPEFPRGKTQIRWLEKDKLQADVFRPGNYYFRIRGVNQRMELSRFSPTQSISVMRPEMPAPPSLSANSLHGYTNETVTTTWPESKGAKTYQLEVRDGRGQVVQKVRSSRPGFEFKSSRADNFTYRVTSVDQWGRRSKPAAGGNIAIENRPVAEAAPTPAPPRQIASTTSVIKIYESLAEYRNRLYARSTLEFEGASSTLYSGEQLQRTDVEAPLAAMISLRTHYWADSNGAEASIKFKAFNFNSSAELTSPRQAEVRYLHRWAIPFNPFWSFRDMKVGTILGFEDYHNSGGTLFSPGYDLVKVGFFLAFPAFQRWDTGGEVLYGGDLKNDKKYEVSGYFHYFLKHDWSLGLGYRVHLFAAGSADSAPNGLPFREGYGEGYSVLRYHY